jgi:dUTP pyrophosphatase
VEIKKGEKIAQLVIHKCELPELEVVDALEETERSSGGFGSTGRF